MVDLPFGPQKFQWYGWHKWVGITVFLVALVRLSWRYAHPAPPPVTMPEWQRKAAHATHVTLYVLMLAIPLSGWLYSSATGVSVVYLGLVPLPDVVPKDKALAAILKAVHITLNFTLLALVFVHTGAVLKHHLVDRDSVLARMTPFLRESLKGLPRMQALRSFIPPLAAMLMAAAGGALAQGVLIDKSEIRFVSKQMGVNVEGRFRKWKANVDFRPQDLAHSGRARNRARERRSRERRVGGRGQAPSGSTRRNSRSRSSRRRRSATLAPAATRSRASSRSKGRRAMCSFP